jgi:hypothetical protein
MNMAYQKYTGLADAAAILTKVSEFAASNGWTILQNCVSDLPIDGSSNSDGVLLSLKSADGTVFGQFRTADGKKIFPSQRNDGNAYGIGLVASTAHTDKPASGYWYDQPNAPKHVGTQEVLGVGIPVNPAGGHTLYCNTITEPAPLLIVSVETDGVFQHLALGALQKIGDWDGGLILSGSRNSYNMFTASKTFDATTIETESVQLFSMTTNASTFLRADIDAAPLRNPSILWASAGPNDASNISYAYTGKQLALPVKTSEVPAAKWNAFIPDYSKLQSQNTIDSGRNVNTLNCITVNMNLVAYVLRDPDGLRNFSPVGYVPGTYFISMRNVAPGQMYEISYPKSGLLHQVFPYTRRRGIYGMDGFSVQQ